MRSPMLMALISTVLFLGRLSKVTLMRPEQHLIDLLRHKLAVSCLPMFL